MPSHQTRSFNPTLKSGQHAPESLVNISGILTLDEDRVQKACNPPVNYTLQESKELHMAYCW